MRISDLSTGLEHISRSSDDGAFQLPVRQVHYAEYLPQVSQLDAAFRWKALDGQLVDLLLPKSLDTSLLEPSILAATRKEIISNFTMRATADEGSAGTYFAEAAKLLSEEDALCDDVQNALAVLLRG